MAFAEFLRSPTRGDARLLWRRALAVAVVAALVGTSIGVLGSVGSLRAASPSAAAAPAPWPVSGSPVPGAPHYHLESIPLGPPSLSPAYYTNGPEGWLAYDPVDRSFWVADTQSGDVVAIPMSSIANYSMQASTSYPLGRGVFGVAVDNSTGIVAVTNSGSNNLSLISGSLGKVVGSATVGTGPKGVAIDDQTGRAYVANSGSGNVTVVSESAGRSIANITVGSAPFGVAYDPIDQEIFVANSGSNNVSVISISSNRVVANLRVGTDPIGVAWDGRNDTILVTNNGSQNISILSGAHNSVVGAIDVNGTSILEGIAYDSGQDEVWAGAGWDYLVESRATSGSATTFIAVDPSGVAYAPTGWVCFTNSLNRTFECLNSTTPIPPPEYRVAVNESGLPAGTSWLIDLYMDPYAWYCYLENFGCAGENESSASTMDFALPNGTFEYNAHEMVSPYAQANGTVKVAGYGFTLNVSFGTSSPQYYSANFRESGLPAGTNWTVDRYAGNAASATTSVISFALVNGSYAYTIPNVGAYAASPSAGTFTIAGNSVTITITFYSTSGGGNRTPSQYAVTFRESGLPSSTHWGVAVGANVSATTGTSVRFLLANGTYGYAALPVAGYRANDSGILNVSGRNETVLVNFSVPTFPWILIEFGLPNGTVWHASVTNASGANVTRSTNGTTLVFYLPNGTYELHVWANGYSANLSVASITISGGANGGHPFVPSQQVGFGRNPPVNPTQPNAGASSGSGLPVGALGGIALAAIGIAAAGLGTTAYARRRWRKEGEEIVATLQSLDEDPWRAPGK